MINNEKGNSLITVLLITLVFSVLGLAIISSAIGGAKRVENRESDVVLTYDGVQTVEKITSDIAVSLSNFNFLKYQYEQDFQKRINFNSYERELEKILDDIVASYKENEEIESLKINDVDFGIEKDKDFTRMYEIVLVTNNPNKQEGQVRRTIKKQIIISPIPSFLKYAIGSSSHDSGLYLNGSANIVGNVYANKLTIDEDATYEKKNGNKAKAKTKYSSIIGDLYSSSTNILPSLDEKHFYKSSMPDLKHDSQFVDIDFDESFNDRVNEILNRLDHFTANRIGEGTDFAEDLKNDIQSYPLSYAEVDLQHHVIVGQSKIIRGDETLYANNGDSYQIDSDNEPLSITENIKVKGDLVVTSSEFPISFQGDLVVDGDLYLISYQDLSFKNIFVSGDVHLINFDGKNVMEKDDEKDYRMIVAGNMMIESHASEGNGVELNGDIVTGKNLTMNVHNTAVQINKNIFTNGSLTIMGDEDDPNKENDEIMFDSVVYVGENTFISNVNILGTVKDSEKNAGQLILLSKEEIVLTRLNEFVNYQQRKESGEPYVPDESENIQPLKAFFYTENRAELYGVGSLFYIHGGIFAKEELEINAIRGEVGKDITDLPPFAVEDEFSRFIVVFNEDVFFQQIDALPVVETLQVISDQLLID